MEEKKKLTKDEQQIVSLESKCVMLMNEQTQLKRDLRNAAMKNGIFRSLVEEMKAIVTPFDELPSARPELREKGAVTEHLVMHLSDEHADEIVEPHMVGGLEKFDFNVALCRAERYVDTVIKFTQKTLSGYNFDNLTILSYGDHTSGEIHGATSRSAYQNMFRNCLAIGQMQALMIRDLAPYFKKVNVLCIPGNHGRRSVKKDFHGAYDNYDYLVSEIARMHCKDLSNVSFQIPECFSCIINIEGFDFHLQHGDDIQSWSGLPYYGIERKTRRLVSLHHATGSAKVRYFVMGHFHALTMSSDLNGETIVNGAWPATNPYSYESFAGYREPQQLLHGVNAKHGITWRLGVKLKDAEREAKGPQRYKIDLSDKEFNGH